MLNNSPYPIRKINGIHPKDSTHVSFFEEMRRLKTPQAIGMSKYFNRKYYHSVDKTNHKTNLRIGDSPISKEYISKKLISMKSQSNLVNNDLNDFSYNSNQNNKSINTQLNPSYSFVNNFENSSSFLLSQNTNKIKEKLIQNLKNNFSQERLRRKKMLSVNLNVNINQNYSMINNNNNNNTTSNTIQPTSITQGNPFLDNSNNNHPNFVSTINKKEQPLKLYTDTNSLKPGFKTIQYLNRNSSTELNLNNRDNFFTSNNCNSGDIEPLERSNVFTSSTINKIFNEKIFDLEVKFDKMIKENVNNSKSRRYNITKLILDEFVKSISQTSSVLSNFLRKILYSYHTSFSMFANENKELKDKVEIYETRNLTLEQKEIQMDKMIKEKETEIESLKTKAQNVSVHSSSCIQFDARTVTFASGESENIANSPQKPIEKNQHQILIDEYNQQNLGDLDALYFNDKVNLGKDNNNQSSYNIIPKLDFDKMEERQNNLHFNYFKNNNIKPTLLKILQEKKG